MVSRETLIAEGVAALGLEIGRREHEKLATLADLFAGPAISRGFIAPGEGERIVPRHILESLALMRWLTSEGVCFDVGSGAGLPGLVLACVRSGPGVLVEAQARRAGFLRECVRNLDLDVEVIRDRAEDVCRGRARESAIAVTARALAPPAEALELTMPLAQQGGVIALLVGFLEGPELAGAQAAAGTLGGAVPVLERFEVPGAAEPRWAMIVRKLRSTPDRYPRPPGPRRRRPAGGDVV